MDLPPPLAKHSFDTTMKVIHEAATTECTKNMLAAVEEEVEATGGRDLKVSGDGTWLTRGYSSKIGVVTLVGQKAGKALDYEVLSTVCNACNNYSGPKEGREYETWWAMHKEDCTANHSESAGMMEVNGMISIFHRSESRSNVKYTDYIGDGDTKTYTRIVESKPYEDVFPTKIECTGHVQKRMGTRLRHLKKDSKGKKLSDGKTIGGRGRLTDMRIDQFASYYGNATRSSKTVDEMKKAVWAIFHHYRSTDKKPEHHLCPPPDDPECWCRYNRAVKEGTEKAFRHKNNVPVPVMNAIKPVFKDLTKDELLVRCVGAYTQNPNESLNNLIWKVCPKTVFVGKRTVETASAEAIVQFNMGLGFHVEVLKAMGITVGNYCVSWVNAENKSRLKKAAEAALQSTKEARMARRRANLQSQDEDDPAYPNRKK